MTSARKPSGAPEPGEAASEIPDQKAGNDADLEAEGVEADLDALLADVRRERDEYLELAQRAKADFENYRKRAARDTAEAEKRGTAKLAREVVPAIDNLERALSVIGVRPSEHSSEPVSEEVSAEEAFARGVALVLDDLRGSLERAGVEAYDPVGERFDPAWHEALSTRSEDGGDSGIVLETLERGYRLDGQVLRPARVVVSS